MVSGEIPKRPFALMKQKLLISFFLGLAAAHVHSIACPDSKQPRQSEHFSLSSDAQS